jgi:hypothetical protein
MTCDGARAALLVADLGAPGAGDLANHLATCADCRARVDMLRGQTAILAATVERRHRRRRSRRLALAASVPIAAAVVAGVTFRASHNSPEVAPATTQHASLPVARRVSLTLGPGQSAAVLRTADTTVTVIWFTGAGQ